MSYTYTNRVTTNRPSTSIFTDAQRLRSLANNLRNVENANRNLSERLDRERELSQRRINDLQGRLSAERQNADRRMTDLRNQLANEIKTSNERLQNAIAEQEARTGRLINEQRQYTNNQIRTLRSEMENISRTLSSGLQELDDKFTDEISTINVNLSRIDSTLNNYAQNDAERFNAASVYLENADILYADATTYTMAHTGLTENDFNRVGVLIQNARDDQKKGPTNSSVFFTSARAAMNAALDLQLNAVKGKRKWNLIYHNVCDSIDALLEDIKNNRTLTFNAFGDGDCTIDVNEWSLGAFNTIETTLLNIRNELNNPDNLSIDRLNIYRGTITVASGDLDRAIMQAASAFVESDARVNLCDDAKNVLENEDFTFIGAGFEGGDVKNAFRVHLCHKPTGIQCFVTAKPVYNDDGTISLEFTNQFNGCQAIADTKITEEIEITLRNSIADYLRKRGHEIEDRNAVPIKEEAPIIDDAVFAANSVSTPVEAIPNVASNATTAN